MIMGLSNAPTASLKQGGSSTLSPQQLGYLVAKWKEVGCRVGLATVTVYGYNHTLYK